MMRLWAIMVKELLLLVRDRAGLAVLYLMPVSLVVIMAVVQDAPFRSFQEQRISILFRNLDQGKVGQKMQQGLEKAGAFQVFLADSQLTEAQFRDLIRKGDYQVGIVVPEGMTTVIANRNFALVDRLLVNLTSPGVEGSAQVSTDSATVQLIIDPTVKLSFRQTLHSVIERLLTGIASAQLVEAMQTRLGELTGSPAPSISMNGFGAGIAEELASADAYGTHVATNSTQHNVPAWTIFAMFFMVVPLSGNMVKERATGAALRLKTMPGHASIHLAGKVAVYLSICITQFLLLVAVGQWVMPLLGLHPLVIGSGLPRLLLAALGIGLAATAYGIVVGTIFHTHQQSAIFGAVSVVILSAIGGVWVPLYVMPGPMQVIGSLSPMAWSLEAFNVVLLRNGGWAELLPQLAPLMVFSLAVLGFAVWFEQKKSL